MIHRVLVCICRRAARTSHGCRPGVNGSAADGSQGANRRLRLRRAHRTASPICRAFGRTPRIRRWSGPKNVTKEFFTEEEAVELAKQAAEEEGEQTEPEP